MKVVFYNNWFAPNGQMFRKSVPLTEEGARHIPDKWADQLPKTAKVVGRDKIEALDPKRSIYRNAIKKKPTSVGGDAPGKRMRDHMEAQNVDLQRQQQARDLEELGEVVEDVKDAPEPDEDLTTRVVDPDEEGEAETDDAGSEAEEEELTPAEKAAKFRAELDASGQPPAHNKAGQLRMAKARAARKTRKPR